VSEWTTLFFPFEKRNSGINPLDAQKSAPGRTIPGKWPLCESKNEYQGKNTDGPLSPSSEDTFHPITLFGKTTSCEVPILDACPDFDGTGFPPPADNSGNPPIRPKEKSPHEMNPVGGLLEFLELIFPSENWM
jgi:hypothetical protein